MNTAVINVKDILSLLDKMEGKFFILSLVTANYNLLSPSNFEPLTDYTRQISEKNRRTWNKLVTSWNLHHQLNST